MNPVRLTTTAPPTRRAPARARGGFTLIEALLGLVLLGLLLLAVAGGHRAFAGQADSLSDGARQAEQRQRVRARLGEVGRIAPQLGDLSAAYDTALAFRERIAPSASACASSGGTAWVRLAQREAARVVPGDSVALLTAAGTWTVAQVASAAASTPCASGAVAGTQTFAVALPAAATISAGASALVWTTRRYSLAPDPATGGRQLVERINGGSPVVLYGPLSAGAMFGYYQADGSPAPGNGVVRLVRATLTPLVTVQRRLVASRAETYEFAIGADARTTTGTQLAAGGALPPVFRCNDVNANNYGSYTDLCTYNPPAASVAAVSADQSDGATVMLDASGSNSGRPGGIQQYEWTVDGVNRGGGATLAVVASATGTVRTVPYSVRVYDGSQWSAPSGGSFRVIPAPTASFGWSPSMPIATDPATLDASASTAPGSSIAAYEWTIQGASGAISTGSATYPYSWPSGGVYDVSLRVQNARGQWSAPASRTVTVDPKVVTPPPQPCGLRDGSGNVGSATCQPCRIGIAGDTLYASQSPQCNALPTTVVWTTTPQSSSGADPYNLTASAVVRWNTTYNDKVDVQCNGQGTAGALQIVCKGRSGLRSLIGGAVWPGEMANCNPLASTTGTGGYGGYGGTSGGSASTQCQARQGAVKVDGTGGGLAWTLGTRPRIYATTGGWQDGVASSTTGTGVSSNAAWSQHAGGATTSGQVGWFDLTLTPASQVIGQTGTVRATTVLEGGALNQQVYTLTWRLDKVWY